MNSSTDSQTQRRQPAHVDARPSNPALTALSGWRLLSSANLWAIPLVVVMIVMGTLAAMYLGGTVNSSENIKDFPVAIVNADTGATLPDGTKQSVGETITTSLLAGINHENFRVQRLSLAQAEAQMDQGTLYGAIVIPADFSQGLFELAGSSSSATVADKPEIRVMTNPRAGTATPGFVTALSTPALQEVNASVGSKLLADTKAQMSAAGVSEGLSGAAITTLSDPVVVSVTAYNPLPNGTGGGLSAFFYALLIILAGFTGSMIVSTFVDASLGFVPSEFGPVYTLKQHSGLSRLATLSVKWVIMLAVAISASGLYLGISTALGMPVEAPWVLWVFSAAAIFAVAVVAQTVSAIFGGIGLLVNLFLFIVFSLPSAGGTIPLEATPPLFRWLGSFEPMHQIYLGTRSILYLGATLDSGLGRALVFCAIATVLGITVGVIATHLYDRKGPWRGHGQVLEPPLTAQK